MHANVKLLCNVAFVCAIGRYLFHRCVLFAVPADLDVKMKTVLLGAAFLIVSSVHHRLLTQFDASAGDEPP